MNFTLVQKLVMAVVAFVTPILTFVLGRRAGSKATAQKIELERRAGQVDVLKTDVTIDADADSAKREVESRPAPEGTLTNMKAFIERNRK